MEYDEERNGEAAAWGPQEGDQSEYESVGDGYNDDSTSVYSEDEGNGVTEQLLDGAANQNAIGEGLNSQNKRPVPSGSNETAVQNNAAPKTLSRQARHNKKRRERKRLQAAGLFTTRTQRKRLHNKEKQRNQEQALQEATQEVQRLKQKLNAIQCIHCQNALPNYIFLNCYHACLCEQCLVPYSTLEDARRGPLIKCPKCQDYRVVKKFYLNTT